MKTAPDDQHHWRKSSYSGGGDNSCVEVSWRKSSYSGGSGDNSCVEVAFGAEVIGVRDSKNTAGPRLAFGDTAWRAFVGRF
jgi:hypothetical protein